MDFEKRSKELAPFETAARLWCKVHNRDPDAQVRLPHPVLQNAEVMFPYWIGIAEKMEELNGLLGCMQRANRARDEKEPSIGNA